MSGLPSAPPRRLDWQAAEKFTLGATAAGFALCTVLSGLLAGDGQLVASLLAILLVGASLGLAWRETGNPLRLLKLAVRREASWAVREAVITPVLLLALVIDAVLGGGFNALVVVGLAGGLLVAQARLLQTAEVPAWRSRQLVWLFLATGVAEGAGLLALVTLPADSAAAAQAARLAIVLVILRWPCWTFYRDGLLGSDIPDDTKAALRRFKPPFLILGLVAPLLLLVAAGLTPAFGPLLTATGAVLVVVGGWALKYTLLTRPAFSRGVRVPRLTLVHTSPAADVA